MGNMVKAIIHGVVLEWDADMVSIQGNMFAQRCALVRCESLGANTKGATELAELATSLAADPNKYFTERRTRGSGGAIRITRDIYLNKAVSWFTGDILPALQLDLADAIKGKNAGKFVALWEKYGGNKVNIEVTLVDGKKYIVKPTMFKVSKEAEAAVKDAVGKNILARNAIIEAKAAKLRAEGWEPSL